MLVFHGLNDFSFWQLTLNFGLNLPPRKVHEQTSLWLGLPERLLIKNLDVPGASLGHSKRGTLTRGNDIRVSPGMTVRWRSAPCAPPQYCHAIAAQTVVVQKKRLWLKTTLTTPYFKSREFYRKKGIWTPKIRHTNPPPFYAIWTVFMEVGVVLNLLRDVAFPWRFGCHSATAEKHCTPRWGVESPSFRYPPLKILWWFCQIWPRPIFCF